jgi:hypothetical protein
MGLANPALLIFQALKLVENRRFNPEWFDGFGRWLEYSESSDRAFIVDGWNSWNNPSRLKDHVGGVRALTMKLKKL